MRELQKKKNRDTCSRASSGLETEDRGLDQDGGKRNEVGIFKYPL